MPLFKSQYVRWSISRHIEKDSEEFAQNLCTKGHKLYLIRDANYTRCLGLYIHILKNLRYWSVVTENCICKTIHWGQWEKYISPPRRSCVMPKITAVETRKHNILWHSGMHRTTWYNNIDCQVWFGNHQSLTL